MAHSLYSKSMTSLVRQARLHKLSLVFHRRVPTESTPSLASTLSLPIQDPPPPSPITLEHLIRNYLTMLSNRICANWFAAFVQPAPLTKEVATAASAEPAPAITSSSVSGTPTLVIAATTADHIFSTLYATPDLIPLTRHSEFELDICKYDVRRRGTASLTKIVQVQTTQIIVELQVSAPEWREREYIMVAIPRHFLQPSRYITLVYFRMFSFPKPDSLNVPLTRDAWPAHALIDNAFPETPVKF